MECCSGISIIIPVLNGEKWIDSCFDAICKQTLNDLYPIEICVYDDSSNDSTALLLDKWRIKLHLLNFLSMTVIRSDEGKPKGVGFAKNRAVEISRGRYLCFQDIDDVMRPDRLAKQLAYARCYPNAIIGSQFTRDPPDATARFTKWANCLSPDLLSVQIFTSNGPTVIMPTWFCSRAVFDRVGGFSEKGSGIPEDLIFFFQHLDLGGSVHRVEEPLLLYRYHPAATTFSISEQTIWTLRMEYIERRVLKNWPFFTIWNAGKQGRRFWRSLSAESRAKVICFCDVDIHKIGGAYEPYIDRRKGDPTSIPIRHFRECSPPFVICVKLDLTNGELEANIASLNLSEGTDFVMFS